MSAAATLAAASTGKLPHELLLATARGEATPGLPKPTEEQIMDARKASAQFYAPKLMAVAAKVNTPGDPWEELLQFAKGKSRGLPSGNTRRTKRADV